MEKNSFFCFEFLEVSLPIHRFECAEIELFKFCGRDRMFSTSA